MKRRIYRLKYGLVIRLGKWEMRLGRIPKSKRFLGTLPDNPDHLGWTGHY